MSIKTKIMEEYLMSWGKAHALLISEKADHKIVSLM